MAADLHIHTTASDGSLSPTEVVTVAAASDLQTIAITDHDTVGGIEEARAAGARFGVRVIPAIEFSSRHNGKDLHILGFYVDHRHPGLLSALDRLRASREERARHIVDCLQRLGLEIEFSEVLDEANGASVGRPHIARVMVKKGYVDGFSTAFMRYLKRGTPCFFEKFVYPPQTTIALIHEAGGLAIFAHPGLARLDEFIDDLVGMGLDGVEAYHVEHSEQDTERYLSLAGKKGLLVSGGSDCHGPVSTHGQRLGLFLVPDAVAVALATAAGRGG